MLSQWWEVLWWTSATGSRFGGFAQLGVTLVDSHAGSCFGGLAQLGVTLVDSHNWESLWWIHTTGSHFGGLNWELLWWTRATGSHFGGNHSSGVSQQQKYKHCYNFVVVYLDYVSEENYDLVPIGTLDVWIKSDNYVKLLLQWNKEKKSETKNTAIVLKQPSVKGITPKMCRLCFVLRNCVLLNLLCVWLSLTWIRVLVLTMN